MALEQRLADLEVELAKRDEELGRVRTELANRRGEKDSGDLQERSLGARLSAIEKRLRMVTAERDASLREVDRRSSAANELGARIPQLEAELDQREREAAALEAEFDEREREAAALEAEASRLDEENVRLDSEVVKLKQTLERTESQTRRQAAEYGARVRELEQLVSTLAGGLAQTREDIGRAAGSRAWRWGHGATRALRRVSMRRTVTEGALSRALKRIEQLEFSGRALAEPTTETASTIAPSQIYAGDDERSEQERAVARGQLGEEIRERLGPAPKLPSWPPISIIVPTREGLDHLERLFDGLAERTDYPEFELIVVDNASEDGTREFIDEFDAPFPVRTVANTDPATFSRSNAQGVEVAAHDLFLFLNNDVEPFERGWLRELVAALSRDGVAAAGATLLRSEAGNDPASRDLTVQHRSIKFRAAEGGIRAYNSGDGQLLWDSDFGIEQRSVAVTAACMLISRERFQAAGGFGEVYRFGTEDVDLGLKLCAGGESVVASGRSILYHRESATQDSEGRDFKRTNRLLNRRCFLERWGSRVRREYRLGRLRGDRFWTDGQGPHAAITLTSLDPVDGWGDWYTGHELGDALAALGWRITYVERKGDRWYDLPGDLDYVISLMDPFDLGRVPPEVTTIAWIRNWTERWLDRPWFDRADVILTSSGRTAELIEETTGRKTFPFPLATNPARFSPGIADAGRAADYVFTGNHWGKDREIQAGLEPRDRERLDVYGKGWDKVPAIKPHARGSAPYDDLPAIYSSAKLVLDDTSGPTLPYGAVNSRVFDALASGTLAITNCESGVRELFGEDFPVWRSAGELREQIDALLGDEERREALASRFRAEVLRRHTYAHRARRLVEILEDHEERPSFCIKIGAPDWERAERWGDLHFARAIERELRGRGHPCLIQVLNEWESAEGLVYDVALVIRGLSRHHPKPGQVNVLWNISHPADLTGEECDGYDLVCVASATFAKRLEERTKTPVIVLEQATDPAVFYPDRSPEYEHDLVYVANSRNVLRPIVRDLLPTDHDLAIYGGDWEGLIDTKYVVKEWVPNDELRKIYSSAKLVLCDHWDDMREHGFISNRIYDALACGATVISDEVVGLDARFPSIHTYSTPQELRALVDESLSEPGQAAVKPPEVEPKDLTFQSRCTALLEAIGDRVHATHAAASLT